MASRTKAVNNAPPIKIIDTGVVSSMRKRRDGGIGRESGSRKSFQLQCGRRFRSNLKSP
jgi:hypothetical protein